MTKVNSICFDPARYGDKDDMWYNIRDILETLIRNGYIIVLREEDFGLTFVEFSSDDRELGEPYPFWLSPEEEGRLVYDDDLEKEGAE